MTSIVYNSYGQEVGSINLALCKVYRADRIEAGWIDFFNLKCCDVSSNYIGWIDPFQGIIKNLPYLDTAGRVDIGTFAVYDKNERQVGRISMDFSEIAQIRIKPYNPCVIAMVYAGSAALLLLLR